MQVKFDALDRFETPHITLCNPGSILSNGVPTRSVGILACTSDEELVLNFNSLSEMNFRFNKIPRDDDEENEYIYGLFKALQRRRLLYVDGIGYFLISGVTDGFNDEMVQYKDVRAVSAEAELQNKKLPYIADGTYRLKTLENEEGILDKIVATLPLWTIGHVDESISDKYRTFEDVDEDLNVLAFFMEDVQEAYECIFDFDITNRKINVYDQNNYAQPTSIHLTKQDLINSLNIKEEDEDLFTALQVLGDENVTIAAVNPTGSNVIYNFEEYLDWMPSDLRDKVVEWSNNIVEAEEPYYTASEAYYELLEEENNLILEIEKINMQITMYQRLRNNIIAESITSQDDDLVAEYNAVIVANGGVEVQVYEEIADTYDAITNLIAECETNREQKEAELGNAAFYSGVRFNLSVQKQLIDSYRDTLSFENYFSDEEQEELINYIYEGSYTDDYVIISEDMAYPERFEQMKILYDRAKKTLGKTSQPLKEFEIDVENFIFEKRFLEWSGQIKTGCLINIEIETDDIAELLLTNITVNYDDKSLKMTFGNRLNKSDPRSLFEDVLGSVSKSANSIDYIKDIILPLKDGELDHVKKELETSRNLAMDTALASSQEEVVIDGSGYTGRKKVDEDFDPRQVKLTSNSLVFTDDAWQSCRLALGEFLLGTDGDTSERLYGINAEVLVGELILGRAIKILSPEGKELFTVIDNKISAGVSEVTSKVNSLEQKAAALEIGAEGISARVEKIEDTGSGRVVTSTGYVFDENGLTISEDGVEINNTLNNTGMYVKRTTGEESEVILEANASGVNAYNLTARQYLIVGKNSRFEDYSNGTDEKRTACFYIGE